jgi:glutamate dehydrogenase
MLSDYISQDLSSRLSANSIDWDVLSCELSSMTMNKLDGFSQLQQILSDPQDGPGEEDLHALSDTLFSHAPDELLKSRTTEELLYILRSSADALKRFEKDGGSTLVELSRVLTQRARESAPGDESLHDEEEPLQLISICPDRPFILNSLREGVLLSGGSIEIFLHPVLTRGDERLSLIYLELRDLSFEKGAILRKEIERTLEHVLLVTEDYPTICTEVENVQEQLGDSLSSPPSDLLEGQELGQFFDWLMSESFLFTGLSIWRGENGTPPSSPQISLGLHRLDSRYGDALREELLEDVQHLSQQDDLIIVSRLRSESLVQRRSQLLNLTLCNRSLNDEQCGCIQITGLLTSKALSEESANIPLLRHKLKTVLEMEGAIEHSHNYKGIVSIFNAMPKEEAFRLDKESLQAVVRTILDVQNRNETRVSVRFDRNERSASVLTVMPRERFNTTVRHRIQSYVEGAFRAVPGSSEYFLDLSSKPHARFYFHVPLPKGSLQAFDLAQLQTDIADLTRGWKDNLKERIRSSHSLTDPQRLWKTYGGAFDSRYQALQSIDDCEYDISIIERLSPDSPVLIGMRPAEEEIPGSFVLVVYKLGEDFTISHALPILEHAGLEVFHERAFHIRPARKEKIAVHRFLVRTQLGAMISGEHFEQIFAPGLESVFREESTDDPLNSLLISAGLSIHSIALLRTYCSLLWQVSTFASKSAIMGALTSTPTAASQLWNMFEIRFNPDFESGLESRQQRFTATLTLFRDGLRDVEDITTDRILRAMANLLEHTTRTNFYQNRKSIALKIHSEKVDIIPQPRPKFEIYVRGHNLEGVHLRGGLVARGGLRWSDRHQDFRQEILDLVKTQNVKNALIVPTGAKGGFIVKDLPTSLEDQRLTVAGAYKEFIRALLSVTDNRRGDTIVHPDRVIPYDGEDPYLVVAADKGTATFSDIANTIAMEEFQFWLGDAFASGGSDGYDHKKYGITARGAWESVRRHFTNLGIHWEQDHFTAVGIGDMSGDVFGNGLLETKNVRLVAAFNHIHIFLDPNPDPEQSFKERKRLFELPRSTWRDYSEELISKGGGVYNRDAREISLSPEVRESLSIPEDTPDTIDGEHLIQLILQAPVDLLWNGGIGTYIKARHESNADVNDGTNDRVRVNAEDVRAKIIGEGGNLGCTQKARIEYARCGGNIYTDAIDNSGGVDLSDHEVNLKILFAPLVASGKMTLEQRNTLLREISHDVVGEVLRHNYNHALILTIAVQRSRNGIDYFRSLLHEMALRGIIQRQIDNLPDDEELLERARRGEGLWKPELAVCLAGVKRWVKGELDQSKLTGDPILENFLLAYFPKRLREEYRSEILSHPLGNNIISTQITNELIDALGITFVHRMCSAHSTSPTNVMKATLAADALLQARELREEVRHLPSSNRNKTILAFLQEIHEALRDIAAWIIGNEPHLTLRELVERYREGFQELIQLNGDAFPERTGEFYDLRRAKYLSEGLSEDSSRTFACFPQAQIFMEILWTAQHAHSELPVVASTFRVLMDLLSVEDLLAISHTIEAKSKWEAELRMTALRDIRRSISLITLELVREQVLDRSKIQERLQSIEAITIVKKLVAEIRTGDPLIVQIAVLARHLIEIPHHISPNPPQGL